MLTTISKSTAVAYAVLLSSNAVVPVKAADSWIFGVTPQLLVGQYSGSEQRDTLFGYGISFNADYLDKSTVNFGYDSQTINGKAENPDIKETNLYMSGRYIHYSDSIGGKLGFRADGYNIKDNTKTSSSSGGTGMGNNKSSTIVVTSTDSADVVYAQVDFMNFSESLYGDIGYSHSSYDYDNSASALLDNNVSQFTLTAGFAFNSRYDWLQSRGYFIQLDHGDNTNDVEKSNALEMKWLHWYNPGNFLNTHSSIFKILLGKRLYAVDPDTHTAYSISDLQTGSVAAGVDWKVGEQGKFLVLIGYDKYENLALSDKYASRYIFSSLSLKW